MSSTGFPATSWKLSVAEVYPREIYVDLSALPPLRPFQDGLELDVSTFDLEWFESALGRPAETHKELMRSQLEAIGTIFGIDDPKVWARATQSVIGAFMAELFTVGVPRAPAVSIHGPIGAFLLLHALIAGSARQRFDGLPHGVALSLLLEVLKGPLAAIQTRLHANGVCIEPAMIARMLVFVDPRMMMQHYDDRHLECFTTLEQLNGPRINRAAHQWMSGPRSLLTLRGHAGVAKLVMLRSVAKRAFADVDNIERLKELQELLDSRLGGEDLESLGWKFDALAPAVGSSELVLALPWFFSPPELNGMAAGTGWLCEKVKATGVFLGHRNEVEIKLRPIAFAYCELNVVLAGMGLQKVDALFV
ncbi:hypothetical protein HK405_004447 [Cladochytrium tenue]|nr:hypothetical protein HK405_004447 [Cladochytrium tenue]